MNHRLFPPRSLFPMLAMMLLIFASFACGGSSAEAPPNNLAGEPGEALPTQPAPPVVSTSIPAIQAPAINETRRVTLEFPAQMRAGDSDRIRLTLEVDDLGNLTPTAQVEGNVVTGEVIEIPNLYESHHVIAEARFDIAGIEVSPPDLLSQTLEQGQSVTFFWSILPQETGVYRGTVWLYLRFVDKVSGEESRRAVSAQSVEIEAVNLFGLSGGVARSAGTIGSVVGAVLGFPFFGDIVKFLFGRRTKRGK